MKEPLYNREGRTSTTSFTADPDNAIEAVTTQLKLWKDAVEKQASSTITCNLKGLDIASLTFKGYLGEYLEEDAAVINTALKGGENADELFKKGIWLWEKLPYTIRRIGSGLVDHSEQGPSEKSKLSKDDELVDDVDEWVLRNEVFLRTLSTLHADCPPTLKAWSFGLVRIADLAKTLQGCTQISSPGVPADCVHALKITRFPIDTVPGYTVLVNQRSSTIFVQPSVSSFKSRFDCMCGGLLAGLDWNNIFIAGGLVLGALLTPDVPSTATLLDSERFCLNSPSDWTSSDIDLYIHGLDVESANDKIQQIAEVYQRNLGSANAPFLVVRNTQTITLYSEWPKRRVQIVLKLVKSPREVLLNFDLDICAVGWDGKQVWMLPRFVRALETGTNVFTMDLVNGHYLGDRKATRDQRIFKYADRGYGIRIIPRYTDFLQFPYSDSPQSAETVVGEGLRVKELPLSLPLVASQARAWTQEIVNRYIQNDQVDGSLTFHWPKMKGKNGLPVFTHAILERYGQISSDPPRRGRSCLTGFSLLMRHVALWELEIAGTIDIHEHIFAEDAYNNIGQLAYDDTPAYEWNDRFAIPRFTTAIDVFSECETNDFQAKWACFADDEPADFPVVKRVTYASAINEIFADENNMSMPIFTTHAFVRFANEIVMRALKELNLVTESSGRAKTFPLEIIDPTMTENGLVLALWRLDRILTWQMVDRRIDEVREVLWEIYRASPRSSESEDPIEYLRTNPSRRTIRTSEQEECTAFVRWVGRDP
ncbi:hypothetical protein EV360DRAFT_88970 [Lentinula raphanica]|nr:hypothetical protein EV360DRAFT_88970 [Lentinula raphanica]